MQRVEAGGRNEHLLLYSAPQWGSFSLRHVCSAGDKRRGAALSPPTGGAAHCLRVNGEAGGGRKEDFRSEDKELDPNASLHLCVFDRNQLCSQERISHSG
ncbi:hypothetical protein Q8A67_008324 [Cirrhinus molitorella]|uniref:Uncharacterized protein n=1 Tax=Cirrhinus molitorella TaxID=172907 RepID=A0AA88TUD6_9TELE|nr:hypothetical protein Q8A67_008324 [Cirrhinus molitorella]